jgi:hypothetical protein
VSNSMDRSSSHMYWYLVVHNSKKSHSTDSDETIRTTTTTFCASTDTRSSLKLYIQFIWIFFF